MANPSLAMIPSGYKAGKLYSVLPQDGTGDFTVVSDQKYVTGSTGLLELVPANTPAFDYSDGSGCPALLVEGVSTNLALWSEDFSNAVWAKQSGGDLATITPNQGAAPNGNNESWLIELGSDPLSRVSQSILPVLSGFNYTYSIWLRSDIDGTYPMSFFQLGGGAQDVSQLVTLTSEWKRFEFTLTTITTNMLIIYLGNRAKSLGETITSAYIWGAKLEQSSTATSYIPTTTTSVTRAADIETVTTPSGVTSITETIGGVEQTPITVIPTTYQIPNGLINKITMI